MIFATWLSKGIVFDILGQWIVSLCEGDMEGMESGSGKTPRVISSKAQCLNFGGMKIEPNHFA